MYISEKRRQAFYHLRSLGYSPIPMRRGKRRRPHIMGWTEYAARQATDDEIERWCRLFPTCNIAVCGGFNGLLAVDIDDPALVEPLGRFLPTETTTKRGSKGLTAFYRTADTKTHVLNVNGKAAVEFLGVGRLTTVPPSEHDGIGKPYQWIGKLRPVAELPELAAAEAFRMTHGEVVRLYGAEVCTGGPSAEVDAPQDAAPVAPGGVADGRMRIWAMAALDGEAEKLRAAGEGGRANQLFACACALGKYVHHGVLTEAEVVERLIEACDDNGLLADEGGEASIRAQCASGFSKAQNDVLPILGPTAEEWFGSAPAQLPPGASREPIPSNRALTPVAGNVFEMVRLQQIPMYTPMDTPVRRAPGLIQHLYPLGNPGDFSYLFGGYGSKKTFYSLYRSICIAAGIEFFGFRTQQRFTVYYAAENDYSVRVRMHAIFEHLKLNPATVPFVIIPNLGNLRDPAIVEALIAAILEKSARWGPCGLLDFDTITEAFRVEDENAPREWLDIQHTCREIGRRVGGAVNAIHHTGKDLSRGGRGSSAIGGSHDFSITCSVQEDDSTMVGRGPGDKMRDVSGADYPPVAFRIERHILDDAPDIFGDPWTSGYPVATNAPVCQPKRTKRDQVLYDAVAAASDFSQKIIMVNVPEVGERRGRPSDDVRFHFDRLYDGSNGMARKAWFEINKELATNDHAEFIIFEGLIMERYLSVT